MEPLLFIIIALLIGAATRHFLRKSPLPYTVLLLITGILIGAVNRMGYFEGPLHSFSEAVRWAGHIDPHVILFVFLPTLIFEAAFAMDVHTFKKSLTNATILAVPGIVFALFLTAALVIALDLTGIGLHGWGWPIALMFGSVISATDPVAVVAILKELGVSKKLSTLIDGESLLNDGTGIVFFMVFYLPLVGMASESSPVFEFTKVVFGGILLGIVIGAVCIAWVKKVFNDALVEISIIVAGAYLTFFVAEHFLHVSGVLGLVALGLAMAGVGRTRISPEVEHFLHEFWELAAFIANTLIFIIVGVVIAERTVFTANDFLILLIIYAGIHIIRALLIIFCYPFMRKTGYGLTVKESFILWYGALRGAVGLALALVVAGVDDEYISPEIKNQFLFLIAGTVTMTLLINATTMKYLLEILGFTKIPAAKALLMSGAVHQLTDDTKNSLELLKGDRFLSGANWNSVRQYLPQYVSPEVSEEEMATMDVMAESRRRILQKEQSSYWSQFKNGLLGAGAVRKLSEGISETLDHSGKIPLSDRAYLSQLWSAPKVLTRLSSMPLLGNIFKSALSERLAMNYDTAQGFVVAQEQVLKLVETIASPDDFPDKIEKFINQLKEEITQNRLRGLEYIKTLRTTHPEIATAIQTKQAIRSVLNHEKNAIGLLQNEGRIEQDEAQKMIKSVEERMKLLFDTPASIKLSEPMELLNEVAWLKGLGQNVIEKVRSLAEVKGYSPGDKLMVKGGPGDGMFIVSMGTVKISIGNFIVDILGPGSLIGEMAVLTGYPRTADVTAETNVTVLRLPTGGMRQLMLESIELSDRLWDTAGKRFAENLLGKISPYNELPHHDLRKWISEGTVVSSLNSESIDIDKRVGVVVFGSVTGTDNHDISAPAIIHTGLFRLMADARVFVRGK